MNKTININLAGFVFHIDDNAYQILRLYLDDIYKYMGDLYGKDEIMKDVEVRIAEIFQDELQKQNKEVVTESMVAQLMNILGEPKEFMKSSNEEDLDEESQKTRVRQKTVKKFFRDPGNKIISGVCGGVATYLNVDSTIVRILVFISFIFTSSFTFFVYIIIWLVVPEAKSVSDRLRMKGKPINFSNLVKNFERETSSLRSAFQNNKTNFEKIIEKLFKVFLIILKILIITAFAIIIFALIFSVVLSLLSLLGLVPVAFGVLGNFPEFLLGSSILSKMLLISLIFIIIIPLAFLIMLFFQLMFKKRVFYWQVSLGMIILWLLGIGVVIFSLTRVFSSFINKTDVKEVHVLNTVNNLKIRIEESEIDDNSIDLGIFNKLNRAKVEIKKSNDDRTYLKIIKTSYGHSLNDARQKAKEILYLWEQNDSILNLSQDYVISKETSFRMQMINIELYIPVGKKFIIEEPTNYICIKIHKNKFLFNDMFDVQLEMTSQGVECIETNKSEIKSKLNVKKFSHSHSAVFI